MKLNINKNLKLSTDEFGLLIKENIIASYDGALFFEEVYGEGSARNLALFIADHDLKINSIKELQIALNEKFLRIYKLDALKSSPFLLKNFFNKISDGRFYFFEIYGDLLFMVLTDELI